MNNYQQIKTETKTIGSFVDYAKEQLFECSDKEEREAAIKQVLLYVEQDLKAVHND